MTRPKGKLFALLAIFLAIGIVTATGAFTSVSAERTVDASVQGDQAALVGLTPHVGGNGYNDAAAANAAVDNSYGYAQINNGVLTVNLGGFDDGTPQSQGLNYNATTDFDYVFNITNNGAQDFEYYITRDGEVAGADNAVVFYQGQAGSGNNVTAISSNARTLSPGSTEQVSIQVDLSGVDSSDVSAGTSLLDGITIHADAP